MVYICAKCKFLFERKNEPSKCPSCESLGVMDASENERKAYKHMLENQGKAKEHNESNLDEPL